MFLSIEGIDGAGKTTQCQLLLGWLKQKGYDVVTCREPGGTWLGEEIRGLLKGTQSKIGNHAEVMLFLAARAQLVEDVIRPAIQEGKIVLSDRFDLSTIAYQSYGLGLNYLDVQVGLDFVMQGVCPTWTGLLDLSVEVAASRSNKTGDRIEDRGQSFMEKVRHGYLQQAKKHSWRVRVFDASLSEAEVHQQIVRSVMGQLGKT